MLISYNISYNLDDIMEAVKILDEKTDDLPVELYAVRLNNLPP